jgi:hypothetical protein
VCPRNAPRSLNPAGECWWSISEARLVEKGPFSLIFTANGHIKLGEIVGLLAAAGMTIVRFALESAAG